jgi:hypothetical protein
MDRAIRKTSKRRGLLPVGRIIFSISESLGVVESLDEISTDVGKDAPPEAA